MTIFRHLFERLNDLLLQIYGMARTDRQKHQLKNETEK